jgi:TldD protein
MEGTGRVKKDPGSKQTGWARRDVLTTLALASVTAGTARRAHAAPRRLQTGHRAVAASALDPMIVIDGTDVKALALRTLDAAKSAGAEYADVHLTRTLHQEISLGEELSSSLDFTEAETFGVGVRVRAAGAWGFAASAVWTSEEVVALAQEAAAQARVNARVTAAGSAWPTTPVATGHWATPITTDPFTLLLEERLDYLRYWQALAFRYRGCRSALDTAFTREERAVATSEGSYVTQTLYQSSGTYRLHRDFFVRGEQKQANAYAAGLTSAAAGWELFEEADLPNQIPFLHAEADPWRTNPPMRPGEVGRYDVVFDASTMGSLMDRTFGAATQLDRVLGYEANAGGTSYLGPNPLELLGTYQAASPLVTVTANRSMPRGVGTVKWDDEGVEPDEFTLVKDGLLVDYQTTRALAPVLAPYYQKLGKPVRSHGCAWSENATCITTQHTPNLVLEPGSVDVDFEGLVGDTKKGLYVTGATITVDFQQRTGFGMGGVLEIVNGQLTGTAITGLKFLFSTAELWKNVVALGGAPSVLQYASAASTGKGQPLQTAPHSVRSVPAKVTNVSFIDMTRKT